MVFVFCFSASSFEKGVCLSIQKQSRREMMMVLKIILGGTETVHIPTW